MSEQQRPTRGQPQAGGRGGRPGGGQPGGRGGPPEPARDLVGLANEAVRAFREDDPDSFKQLVQAFEGKSADVALLGHGRFHVAVQNGEVRIDPDVVRGAQSTGRGAIAPETLLAIAEGRMTPLEAFFKGDLIARADSTELHLAYDHFVRFSDAALRSRRLQEVLARFREAFKD